MSDSQQLSALLQNNSVSIVSMALWISGILWMMPGRKVSAARNAIPGLILTIAGIAGLLSSFNALAADISQEIMFWVFSMVALVCATLMITARNPVYAALFFALATLSTCGLFMLQNAPFLAAATVIVYAGAVIVTFLFVIMLAQQSGAAGYDQTAGRAAPPVLASFVLLGTVSVLVSMAPPEVSTVSPVADSLRLEDETAAGGTASAAAAGGGASMRVESVEDMLAREAAAAAEAEANRPEPVVNLLSRATASHPVGSMKGLGRSLFGDYLFAVELAGTILLIACIGAIAIAPRREEGAL